MKRLYQRSSVALFIIVLTCLSSVAIAQTKTEIRAFQLYKDAKTSMKAGKFDEACHMLDEAYKLYPQANIMFRKAACLEAKDEPVASLKTLKNIKKPSSRLRVKIKAAINRLTILMNKPVKVTVVTPESGAEVLVDGTQTCKSPCNLNLARGTHTFRITQDGYSSMNLTKDIRGLTGKVINVQMKRMMQKVNIAVQPAGAKAKVLVDGNAIPAAKRTADGAWAIELATGKHTIAVMSDNYETYFRDFIVKPGTEPVVSCYLKSKSRYWTGRRIGGWTMVGAGAVMTGVGIYLIASYYSDKSLARNTGQSLKSNKQYIGPVLIGVGVATAACSYFLLRKPKKKGIKSVSLSVTPKGAFIGTVINF